MVRLMTSFISASMSKKRRIPDGGISRTRSLRKSAGARRVVGWLVIWRQVYPSRVGAVHPLPCLDADRQPVGRPRQRTGGVWREDARRVVRAVEVDRDAPVGGRSAGVKEPSAAVGLGAVGEVAEDEPQLPV